MTLQEWIGSIISLLGLAILFFFNERKVDGQEPQSPQASPQKNEDEEESNWQELLQIVEKPKVKNQKSLGVSKVQVTHHPKKPAQKAYRPINRLIEDDSDDLNSNRPVLRSPFVARLRPIPSIHGEFVDRSPKVRKTIKSLKSLRTLIICREVMERPHGKFSSL